MMLVKSPKKKGEKNKEIWSRDHSISEGEVGKRIQNQARRVKTKKAGAVCPSKVARGNDTATDPSTGAAAKIVYQPPAAATSAASTAKPEANDYNAATTTEPGASGCAARACQEGDNKNILSSA